MITYNHNGFAEKKSVFALQSAELVNDVIGKLPVARPLKLWSSDFDAETSENVKPVENFKAIFVESEKESGIVNCPTQRYAIVSHEQAIHPIIDALVQSGVKDFEFNAQSTLSWANLNIFVGGAGYDSVKLGFKIGNSFDSSSSVNYGFEATARSKSIVLVGFRTVCQNGMRIEVPLDQAELIKPELRVKITTLLSERTRVLHTKSAESKIDAIRYVVEAMALLREPAELMIKKAKKWTINDTEHFKALIKLHVGNRFAKKVIHQYSKEPDESLWSLFNSLTFVASHDETLSTTARETLLDKASKMLSIELFPKLGNGGQ